MKYKQHCEILNYKWTNFKCRRVTPTAHESTTMTDGSRPRPSTHDDDGIKITRRPEFRSVANEPNKF